MGGLNRVIFLISEYKRRIRRQCAHKPSPGLSNRPSRTNSGRRFKSQSKLINCYWGVGLYAGIQIRMVEFPRSAQEWYGTSVT